MQDLIINALLKKAKKEKTKDNQPAKEGSRQKNESLGKSKRRRMRYVWK